MQDNNEYLIGEKMSNEPIAHVSEDHRLHDLLDHPEGTVQLVRTWVVRSSVSSHRIFGNLIIRVSLI